MLTDRDKRVIALLRRFRLLQRDQIMRLAPFGSVTRANTRLAALTRTDILSRKQLAVLPGNGSAQALYCLGPCSTTTDSEAQAIRRHLRQVGRAEGSQVEHLLACNEALIALGTAMRILTDVQLAGFRTEPELRQLFAEQSLCPDGWIAWTDRGRPRNAFFEVDLHHEGLTQWRAKVVAYLNYAESGVHEELFGQSGFRVFVVANSERRLRSLRTVGQSNIFLFTEMASLRKRPLEANWLRADCEQRVSLFLPGGD